MSTHSALRSAAYAGLLTFALALGALVPSSAALAQSNEIVLGGDFDIADNLGSLRSNTAYLRGRSGFGTETGQFILVNGSSSAQDLDRDGFTPNFNFTNLQIADTTEFRNIADPSRVIGRQNLVIASFLNPLLSGLSNSVDFYVNIPQGTAAGTYRGSFTVTDRTSPPGSNANGETLRADFVIVEIEVLPQTSFGLVRGDTAARLDSLVLRGRAGQTVSSVLRIANTGNVAFQNARIEATDLVSTSGTGLRIRADRINVSPTSVTSVGLGDTARVTITVRIPTGILAGAYRGDLIVQGDGTSSLRIPLIVIVTTPGDIVFESNPVIGRNGDNAVIIFNGDPGTRWEMAIFDMMSLVTFKTTGTVFAGATTGTPIDPGDGSGPITPGFPGDQAVRYTWPLQNGRGESVAGGMYYVVINVIQSGEPRQLRGKLMVIR